MSSIVHLLFSGIHEISDCIIAHAKVLVGVVLFVPLTSLISSYQQLAMFSPGAYQLKFWSMFRFCLFTVMIFTKFIFVSIYYFVH